MDFSNLSSDSSETYIKLYFETNFIDENEIFTIVNPIIEISLNL